MGGRGSCRARVSANCEIGKSASRERIGLTGRFALPNRQTPDEFGAQEKFVINYWLKPMAWLVMVQQKQTTLRTSLHSTLARRIIVGGAKTERRL
jgi:hypothetical protein